MLCSSKNESIIGPYGNFYVKGNMKHFIQADKDIFYCEGVVTKDGDMVKLSLTDKIIYFHMADRKRLFSDKVASTLRVNPLLLRCCLLTQRLLPRA